MLHAIDDTSVDEAIALLRKGFPVHDESFWRDGLERLTRHHETNGFGPVGYLMGKPGSRTGVALTMVSERMEPDGQRRRVVNLSSWYVEEQARWLAPMMLKHLTAEAGATFTDLTPSPSVRRLIGNLGFQPWNSGSTRAVLPWAALFGGWSEALITGDALASSALTPGQRLIVADHAAMGCITAGLVQGERVSPIVFQPKRRRGLPTARLIYAERKSELFDQFGAVARFLLSQGMVCVDVPARAGDLVPGGWFTTGAPPTFYKGDMGGDSVDHAWSEFVFLRL